MPNGRSKDNISVSLDTRLIELLDQACAETFLSRSDFVSRAVRQAILLSKTDCRRYWDELYQKETEEP